MKKRFLKIGAAVAFVLMAIWLSTWYTNWFISTGVVAGLNDVVAGNPAIVVSFELDGAETEAALAILKNRASQRQNISAAWVTKLSDANILLIGITDWKHASFLERISGLEETSRLAQGLAPDENRAIHTLSQAGKVVLVVVIYMSASLDSRAVECIVNDFTDILAAPFVEKNKSVSECLSN